MVTPRATVARRLLAALDASPSRIPVLLGGCGSGRTALMRQLHDRIGRTSRPSSSTSSAPPRPPSGSIRRSAPPRPSPASKRRGQAPAPRSTRRSRSSTAPAPRTESPATFLLDEFLELRTFESFPGLRRVLHDFCDGLASSGNRFVLTSRYTARALRLLRDRPSRFEVVHVPPFSIEDTFDILGPAHVTADPHEADFLARTVQALGDGRPAYVRALVDELETMRDHGRRRRHERPRRAARRRRPAREPVRVLLRAAPAPRPRLRRPQGDSRNPGRRGRAHAHRDLPCACSARRGRRRTTCRGSKTWTSSPHARSATASPIRCCASGSACTAARRSRPTTMSRAKCTATRCRACRRAEPAMAMAAAGSGPAEDDKKPWGIIEID